MKKITQEEMDALQIEFDEILRKIEDGEMKPEEGHSRLDEIQELTKDFYGSKTIKNTPPEAPKDLVTLWHSYGSELVKSKIYTIAKYRLAIEQIISKTECLESEILKLFFHIQSGRDPMLTTRFRFPWEWQSLWEKEKKDWRFIDEAFSSMNSKNRKKMK